MTATTARYAQQLIECLDTTNGRRLVEHVSEILTRRGVQSVVDIGAGAGALAAHLAHQDFTVLAVEPNPEFAATLAQLPAHGAQVWRCRVQDISDTEHRAWDAAILSYVLDGHLDHADTDQFDQLCAAADELVRPGGVVVAITAGGNSPWSAWTREVDAALGHRMPGGHTAVLAALNASGRRPQRLDTFPIVFAAPDLDQLHDRLAFFYRRAATAYAANKQRLIPILDRHAGQTPEGIRTLDGNEVIVAWTPTHHDTVRASVVA